MVRVTGVIALVLASMLMFLIFARVKTVRAFGHFNNINDPSPNAPLTSPSSIHLQTKGGKQNLLDKTTAPAYPGDFGFVTNGDIVVNVYVPFPDLPRECDIEITHRWLGFRDWLFASPVSQSARKAHPARPTPPTFSRTLIS